MFTQSRLHDCVPQPEILGGCGLAALTTEVAAARTGRPRIHRSGADRVKAHRAKMARLDCTIKPETKATIQDIAESLGYSSNEVVQDLIRFALTNRNWKQVGLMGRSA